MFVSNFEVIGPKTRRNGPKTTQNVDNDVKTRVATPPGISWKFKIFWNLLE